ncbi:MAG: hypothetical protein KKD17_06810 [Nanoarchaeota archaeon]|nr:hypothetical protein [Nanoarchaeota archaeon]
MHIKCVVGNYEGADLSSRIQEHYSPLRPPNSYGQSTNIREEMIFYTFRMRDAETHIIIAKAIPDGRPDSRKIIVKAAGPIPEMVDWMIDDLVGALGIDVSEASKEDSRRVGIEDTIVPMP